MTSYKGRRNMESMSEHPDENSSIGNLHNRPPPRGGIDSRGNHNRVISGCHQHFTNAAFPPPIQMAAHAPDDDEIFETELYSPRDEEEHDADGSIWKMRMEDIRSYFVQYEPQVPRGRSLVKCRDAETQSEDGTEWPLGALTESSPRRALAKSQRDLQPRQSSKNQERSASSEHGGRSSSSKNRKGRNSLLDDDDRKSQSSVLSDQTLNLAVSRKAASVIERLNEQTDRLFSKFLPARTSTDELQPYKNTFELLKPKSGDILNDSMMSLASYEAPSIRTSPQLSMDKQSEKNAQETVETIVKQEITASKVMESLMNMEGKRSTSARRRLARARRASPSSISRDSSLSQRVEKILAVETEPQILAVEEEPKISLETVQQDKSQDQESDDEIDLFNEDLIPATHRKKKAVQSAGPTAPRQKLRRPVVRKIPEEAFTTEDSDAVWDIPFLINDIKPYSKAELEAKSDRTTTRRRHTIRRETMHRANTVMPSENQEAILLTDDFAEDNMPVPVLKQYMSAQGFKRSRGSSECSAASQNIDEVSEDFIFSQQPTSGYKKNKASSGFKRQEPKIRSEAAASMPLEAFTSEDADAEWEIPFALNDVKPYTREQIQNKYNRTTGGAPDKLKLRAWVASQSPIASYRDTHRTNKTQFSGLRSYHDSSYAEEDDQQSFDRQTPEQPVGYLSEQFDY